MRVVKDLLSEQIYKILKNDIINSKINFGEVLVNKNLQERFEVSSTPIRDAILRLKEDGIIEEITRSGAKLIDLFKLASISFLFSSFSNEYSITPKVIVIIN